MYKFKDEHLKLVHIYICTERIQRMVPIMELRMDSQELSLSPSQCPPYLPLPG